MYEDLGFILFFMLPFYRCLVYRRRIITFGLLLACYDVMLIVVLLSFIYVRAIQISKTDLIN